MNHTLKIEPPYFEAILEGRKTFEIRHNDRGYQAGDTVTLREFDSNKRLPIPHRGLDERFTGREINKTIGYVTGYQQHPNMVVFSLV
jgi:ASC-1-like (ASCH) protein